MYASNVFVFQQTYMGLSVSEIRIKVTLKLIGVKYDSDDRVQCKKRKEEKGRPAWFLLAPSLHLFLLSIEK